ncbi:MAG: hypothetical protein JWO56_2518, partial [Acidobacteria bacterium]|nr:hypothetical protein [Acidobacteriota bacterium]
QFEIQLDHYTDEKRLADDSPSAAFIAANLASLTRPGTPLQVCEFGGADGVLLRGIRERVATPVELWNAEVVTVFRDRQILPDIHFVETSILAPDFPDGKFDVTIARNVMHHLIGDSLAESRANQRAALAQMKRVTRPGGLVLIEEHVNQSAGAARILYYLSRLASRMKISIPRFEVTPYTVVAFMTQRMLVDAVEGSIGRPDLVNFSRYVIEWHWKLTGLRRVTGLAFVATRSS